LATASDAGLGSFPERRDLPCELGRFSSAITSSERVCCSSRTLLQIPVGRPKLVFMPSPRPGPPGVPTTIAGAHSANRDCGRVSGHPASARAQSIPRTLSVAASRQVAMMEPLIFFGLIMAYIWELRTAHPGLWMAILGLMLLSYLPWGLLQQYILNGYFLNRFDALLSSRVASLAAATLFCIAHTPNWFLMSVTFVGGYYSTLVYRRRRCLYFLGLAHALLGFLIFLIVPDSITHHLRVGPAWFRW